MPSRSQAACTSALARTARMEEKPLSVALTVTRGKRKTYTVQPLTDAPRTDSVDREQLSRIAALMAEQGMGKADALTYVAHVIGRDVSSANDLTRAEAAALIAVMAGEVTE